MNSKSGSAQFSYINTDLDWIQIQVQGFDDQKLTKIYRWKQKYFYLQENPLALKREHTALQNMKFFGNFFLFL
jgi:hypothetical protein